MDDENNDGQFEIPELPEGRLLEIRLISNWGDPTLIGLNSVEIFIEDGTRARVEKIFSNTSNTSGHIESLLTESLICKDTEKMWCANMRAHNEQFEATVPITISIVMVEPVRIAMCRFWNYNASRVKAQIGVRQVEVRFDGVPVFRGEIDCSFSMDTEFEAQMGDTILFTTDETILESIAKNDVCLISDQLPSHSENRLEIPDALTPYRPTTSESRDVQTVQTPVEILDIPPAFPTRPTSSKTDVKMLHLELVGNWGMRGLIGLTGVEIVDEYNRVIEHDLMNVTCSVGDPEHVKRLFNGKNLTRNHEDMLLVEFNDKKPVTISISFTKPISLKAISIYNYNSSFELSYAGTKVMHIFVNGKLAMSDVMLRKATGFVYFDYVQDVVVDTSGIVVAAVPRPTTHTIGGFLFQLRLLSTWGDEFYVGLNGIEIFDRKGLKINVKEHNLAAFPESVNILPNIKNDLRRSNNLINGINDTDEPKYMWLTPLLPNRCSRVFFVFDTPTFISKMIIYNYRKTPERGVRHVSLSVDDLIIFSGEIPASTSDATAKLEINLQDL